MVATRLPMKISQKFETGQWRMSAVSVQNSVALVLAHTDCEVMDLCPSRAFFEAFLKNLLQN